MDEEKTSTTGPAGQPTVEVLPPEHLLRRPSVPVSIAELAALRGGGQEIIEARKKILQTLRMASLSATSPEDWLLFKSPDGLVTGYLQDAGAERVRDLWGIEIFGVSVPEKIAGEGPDFHYLVRGSGRCKLTGQILEDAEGGRSSTDDFCKDQKGVQLELSVRKAARANLDGNITRELAGLKNVPIEELEAAWAGSRKSITHCRLGRGFGSKAERQGVAHTAAAGGPPIPKCPHCGSPGRVNKGGSRPDGSSYPAFIGCSKYSSHPDKKWIVNFDEWQAKQAKPAAEPAPSPEAPREPGQEG
jgi:hypothetical protein